MGTTNACAPQEWSALPSQCQPTAIYDVFGAAGSFGSSDDAASSAFEESTELSVISRSDDGRVLYADDDSTPTTVIEVHEDDAGDWTVYAVTRCR